MSERIDELMTLYRSASIKARDADKRARELADEGEAATKAAIECGDAMKRAYSALIDAVRETALEGTNS